MIGFMKLIQLIPALGILLTVHVVPVLAQQETPVDPTQPAAEPAPDSAVPPAAKSCLAARVSTKNLSTQMSDLSRAKNLARQAAEAENGGLGGYRAANSMHGPMGEAPCVDNGDGKWTFTFEGFAPGDMTTPIVTTVVTVDQQTFETTVLSNTAP